MATNKEKRGQMHSLAGAVQRMMEKLVDGERVVIHEGSIWIRTTKRANVGDTFQCYEIPLDEVKTAGDLLSWMIHIAEKSWSRKVHLEELARVGAEYLRLDMWVGL
jgi:hypothetical protein